MSPRGSPLPRYGGLDQTAASSVGASAVAPPWLFDHPGNTNTQARDTTYAPVEGGDGNYNGSNSIASNSPGLKRSVSQPVMPLGQMDNSAAALDVALGLNSANIGLRAAGSTSISGAGSSSGGRRSSPRAAHSAPPVRDDSGSGSQGSSQDSSGRQKSSASSAAEATNIAEQHEQSGMSPPGRGLPLRPQGDASPRLSRGLSDGLSRSAAAKRRERRASEVSASASEIPTRPVAPGSDSSGAAGGGGGGGAVGVRPSRARTAQASGIGTEVDDSRSPVWGLKKEVTSTSATAASNIRPSNLTVTTTVGGGGGGGGSRASSLAAASPDLGGQGDSSNTKSSQQSRRAVNSRWLAESPTQASSANTAAAALTPLELADDLAGEADITHSPHSPDSGRFLDPQSVFGRANPSASGNASSSSSAQRSPAVGAATTGDAHSEAAVATAVAKAVRAVEERMASEIMALRTESQAARAAQQRAESLAADRARTVQQLERELATLKSSIAERERGGSGAEGRGGRGATPRGDAAASAAAARPLETGAEDLRRGVNRGASGAPADVAFDVPVGKAPSSSRRAALEARLGMSAAERRVALQSNSNGSGVTAKAPSAASSSSSSSSSQRATPAPSPFPHHQAQQQQQYVQPEQHYGLQRSPRQQPQYEQQHQLQQQQQQFYPADHRASGMRCATCGSRDGLEPDEDNPVIPTRHF